MRAAIAIAVVQHPRPRAPIRAADLLLRLGEGAVGDERLAVADADRPGRLRAVELVAGPEHAAGAEFAEERLPLRHLLGARGGGLLGGHRAPRRRRRRRGSSAGLRTSRLLTSVDVHRADLDRAVPSRRGIFAAHCTPRRTCRLDDVVAAERLLRLDERAVGDERLVVLRRGRRRRRGGLERVAASTCCPSPRASSVYVDVLAAVALRSSSRISPQPPRRRRSRACTACSSFGSVLTTLDERAAAKSTVRVRSSVSAPALSRQLVEVAALRALDAGRAAALARAAGEQLRPCRRPSPRTARSRARRSRRRRRGRRRRRRSAAPVWRWRFVERPPMSQRSHIAQSGSSAISECSAAWSDESSFGIASSPSSCAARARTRPPRCRTSSAGRSSGTVVERLAVARSPSAGRRRPAR